MRRYLSRSILPLALAACGSDSRQPGGADGGDGSDADTAADGADTEEGGTASDDASDGTGPGDVASDTAGDVPADGDTGGEVMTPEAALEATGNALCPGYAEAFCERANGACGCDAAPGFPEPTACRASFEARCRAELGTYLDVARSGQAVFHPEAAPTCLGVLGPLIDACMLLPNDIFFIACPVVSPPGGFGDLPGAGAPCGGVCASGLRCSSSGVCQIPGALDAACGDLRDCAPELVCRAPERASEGRCAAPDVSASGGACAGPNDCQGDTGCLASARKVCIQPTPGQACRYDDDCVTGEYCLVETTTGAGACAPAPLEGEACGNGAFCAAGLACLVDPETGSGGTCGPLPTIGEPCGLAPLGPTLCDAGLGCLDGVCGALPGEGEPCAIGTPSCAPGLGCAFGPEGSYCRVPAGDGARCENDATCQEGFFCHFAEGACRPVQSIGTECSDGNECGPDGACLPDATFTFRCAARPGLGEGCFIDECASDLRCRTPYTAGACVPAPFCAALSF